MPLFIKDLPIHAQVPLALHEGTVHHSVSLPILPSDPGMPPARRTRPQRWKLDTGFTGEAWAWRHHLEEAGLDLARLPLP